MLLMIDNYDSFTWNVVQYLEMLGAKVEVRRNDEIDVPEIERMRPSHIVISPGPGTPDDAGVSLEVVRRFAGSVPMLGVCLGHQVIAQFFEGRIVRARRVLHGKTSVIYHDGVGTLRDLPNPFVAARYHSLLVEADSLPDCLEVTAWTKKDNGERDEIMAVRHRYAPHVEGVQFHPESIASEFGLELLGNFLGVDGPRRKPVVEPPPSPLVSEVKL